MSITTNSQYLIIGDTKLHYIEAGHPHAHTVLLLHGASFSAKTWLDLGTLTVIDNNNYRAIALDLPGYGKSGALSSNANDLLLEIISLLNLAKPIIVSPSMSGQFSLPLIAQHPGQVAGFVAVAPVGIPSFEAQLQDNKVPTLAIWGSDDQIVPVIHAERLCQVMSKVEKVILEDAGHACYMQATQAFHQHLLKFITRCY
jgi:abhydrolase domain-containing protein 14